MVDKNHLKEYNKVKYITKEDMAMPGVLVVLLLVALFGVMGILFYWLYRSEKAGLFQQFLRPDYDERQKQISAQGVGYAFATTNLLAFFYLISGRWIFPTVSANFVATSFLWLPTTVFAAYSIIKGSYFALNVKKKQYDSLFAVLGLLGLLMLGMTLTVAMEEGAPAFFGPSGAGQSLFLPLSGLVEVLAYLYRRYLDAKVQDED